MLSFERVYLLGDQLVDAVVEERPDAFELLGGGPGYFPPRLRSFSHHGT
jgi:hypothetical protein